LPNLELLFLNANQISHLGNIEVLRNLYNVSLDYNPIPEAELDKLGGKRDRKTVYHKDYLKRVIPELRSIKKEER